MNRNRKYCALIPVLIILIPSINFCQINTNKRLIDDRLQLTPAYSLQTSNSNTSSNHQPVQNRMSPNTIQHLIREGSWPYGSSLSVAFDSLRNLVFLGSGGAVLIIDADKQLNLQLVTDTIRTTGLVKDIFYDPTEKRLYLACGEGGFEIWDIQLPEQPELMSRTEIIYYQYEVPVNHVQVKDDYAYLECEWGYVRSVNISNPYNPYQVASNGDMGNPSYDIHIGTEGRLYATGEQNFVIYTIPPDGTMNSIGEIHFTYGCHAVFGTQDVAYVGTSDYLYIIDLAVTGLPFSSPQIDDINHLEVRGNYLYLINNDGFSIWDVTDKVSPYLTGSISMPYLAEDFFLAGQYAYISVGQDGLNIVDISDPSNPVSTGFYDTYSAAIEPVVKDNIAYLTHSDDGLLMIDISNLDYPELIGQYPTSSYVYGLRLKNNLAYLTCWEEGFRIVDVSDPTAPDEISAVENIDAWRLEVNDNYAYVEQLDIPNSTAEIDIFDISDPSSPNEISSIQIPSRAYELVYYKNYLFLADYDSGLRIVNVSDPYNPSEVNAILLPDVLDIFIKDDLLYVCSSDWPPNNGGFHIYDINDPANPVEAGYYGTSGFFPKSVSVVNDYAYVNEGEYIWLFYLDGTIPIYIDRYLLPDLISGISSAGKYLYAADSKAGLLIYKNDLIEDPPLLNWEFQTSGITDGIWDVYFPGLTNGWAAADHGVLLHTTNQGNNWSPVQLGGYADNFRDLTFVNENTGWVCGENSKMFKTTNGGQSWFELNVPTSSVLRSISFLSETLGWAVTLEDHLILKTTDGGVTWTQQNVNLQGNLHFTQVYFKDENNGFVNGFRINFPLPDESFILRTTDGGQNWTPDFTYQDETMLPICFADDNNGWIGGFYGFLLKTTDGGNSWQTKPAGTDNSILSFYFFNENAGWFAGSEGTIYETSDGGESWSRNELLIPDDIHSIFFFNKENGWAVGNNGTILYYHKTSSNIEDEKTGIPQAYSLWQNYPNPFNPNTKIKYSIPTLPLNPSSRQSGTGSYQGEGNRERFITLMVYDVLGKEVATLVNEYKPAGKYEINFNASSLPSGVYFYQIKAGDFVQTKKMILLK